MCGVDLGLSFDAQLGEHRHQRVVEAAERVFRFPHVDDAKAVGALAGDVGKQPFDRPVGW